MSISEILLSISVPILCIGLTARTAITQYFKQREYELVLERYLSGSIDVLAASLEEQIQNFQYNWARAFMVIKQLRDFKDNFDINKADTDLRPVEVSKFNIIAQYRLNEIVGSQAIWQVYQLSFAFLQSANAFITDDLFIMLQKRAGQIFTEKERNEIVELAEKVLREKNQELDKYLVFLQNFHEIGKIIENEKIDFKKIRELKNKDIIKEINFNLNEQFKDQLDKYK